MAKNVLVFDFGSSIVRAILCRYENGRFSLKEIHRFENVPVREFGTLYWDIDDLWINIRTALDLGVFNGGYNAVSIDTWGTDFALLDSKGDLLSKPVHYRDGRTDGMPELLAEEINNKELYMRTGIQPERKNTLFQLYSLLVNEPNMLFKAEKLLMMPDLFAYMLTGATKNEYTIAATSQLIDPNSRCWNLKFIEELGIPPRLFCRLITPGDVYGMLKDEIADEMKIEPIPVFACASHDTASAIVAVPSVEKDFVFISCDAWALFGTELEQPIISEEAMTEHFTNEGGHGTTTSFLKNIMGLWLIQETKRFYNEKQANQVTFSDLERMAEKSVPFKCFINPNDNIFTTPGDMPLKIQRYCKRTNQYIPQTISEVMRCIYDSLAAQFAIAYEELSRLTGKEYNTIYIVGSGTKDRFLCRSIADAIGKKVIAGPVEATVLGNAVSSLIQLGEIDSVAQARSILANSDVTMEYEPQNHKSWVDTLNIVKRYKSEV